MKFGSLFAGIGGFDLGLERAGMTCRWQVEIDEFAIKVLEKHWPDVTKERDIKDVGKHNLEQVECIVAGFPCQDISLAGDGQGIEGERSGLFFETVRVVNELRPEVVILENVAALLVRGLDRVCGELAEIGYDCQWHCIPASYLGAPHRRDRVFIIAHRRRERLERVSEVRAERGSTGRVCGESAGLDSLPLLRRISLHGSRSFARLGMQLPCDRRKRWRRMEYGPLFGSDVWEAFPEPVRVAHGVPQRLDRLKSLGNAVVPQVAEYIGNEVMEWYLNNRL